MQLLTDMAIFVAVANAKSFSKAAEHLGLAKSTTSIRMSKLEQYIGLRLLNRTTRKIELTEAGRIYYERAIRIVEEANLAHQQLGEMLNETTGNISISLPVEFAHLFIAPILPEFCQRYPSISFNFHLSPNKVDLISEPFDLAIRIGKQPDSALVSRLLAEISGGLYASPNYLERSSIPSEILDISNHQCIQFRMDTHNEWRLFNQNQQAIIPIQGKFVTNSPGMNLRLAEAGLGIALLPDLIARESIQKGRLVAILPQWRGLAIPVYAMTATRLLPTKVQVFIDFLIEKFREYG